VRCGRPYWIDLRATLKKRTKLMGLESEFENFCIQEGESIENMYSRLMYILNELDEVG
jgi:hypothetical protein